MKRSSEILLLGLLLLFVPPAAHSQWIQTSGPKGWSIRSIAPVGPVLYASTYWAGLVFASSDGGSSWHSMSSGLRANWNGILLLRALGTTLFAGTNLGLFRSTDGGALWALAETGFNKPVSGGYSPYDIARLGQRTFLSRADGLYESTDNGDHWKFSSPETPYQAYSDVHWFVLSDTLLFFGGRHGVFRMSLNGTEWIHMPIGVPDSLVTSLASVGSWIFLTGHTNLAARMRTLRSTDGGASWAYAEAGLPDSLRGTITGVESDLYQWAGPGVYRSSDGGESWWLLPDAVDRIWGADGIRYAQKSWADDTLRRSTDHGITWTPLSGPQIGTLITALAAKGDRFVCATWNDQWDFTSTDRGDSWSRMGTERVNLNINALAFCGQYMIAAGTSSDGGIDVSSDAGQSWLRVTPATDAQIEYLAVDSPYVYASGGGGMWVSTDCGASWATRNSGLRSPVPYLGAMTILGSKLIVAEYGGDSLFVSSDHGMSWGALANAGPGRPESISITCLIGEGGRLLAGTAYDGIWRSTDAGVTWTASSAGLGDSVVNDLAAVHGTVFAATQDKGVFSSKDGGVNWEPIGEGLAMPCVNRLLVHGDDLYAGTSGAGVWRRPLSEVTGIWSAPRAGPQVVELGQNYPNPFNPSTTFEFSIKNSDPLILKIFDLLGREVVTLFNGVKEPGRYSVTWNASGMTSGVYLCRLTAGGTSKSIRLLLLR